MRGAVISDLHLFSGRSRGIEELYRLIDEELDLLILNGDIFDFKWNQHTSRQEAYREAQAILRHLCSFQPNLKVIYLSGNHDQETDFDPYLKELIQVDKNFYWFADFLQIGDKLFHHGDLFFKKKMARQPISSFKTKKASLHKLYKGISKIHLNRIVEPSLKAKILCPYIEKHWQDEFDRRAVHDIYFGHSHVPFQNFEVNGRRYHNSGTFIKNQFYEFIQFTVTQEEWLNQEGSRSFIT